ncbi:MAG: Uma2 family endonuclease [Chloroflexi bacterium]|nr:Uma2 family endonuclease [Chloroflexota bacterium]
MTVQPTRRRFSVDEYRQMARSGILGEDDRVELIDGEIIEMAPIGHRHQRCVIALTHLFTERLGRRALVSVQGPIRLSDYTEPQPDVVLLRPGPDLYVSGHPGPDDVFLIVEVAETSSRFDRRVKIPRYGRSGVPECWLVELDKQTVTVYGNPTATGYRTAQTMRRGQTLTPLAFPDLAIPVDEILG